MQTIIKKVCPEDPKKNIKAIKTAAEILLSGGLVAFPTETVYGLGANALDPSAVNKIFEVKNRPPDNPLIIHISRVKDLKHVAKNISPLAYRLADTFWPGPLTMILPKSDIIPYETTAGLDTVAVRIPRHKIAGLLINEAGIPIAAPSANSSGKPSSTLSSHVEFDLTGKIDMIIDGGLSNVGIESTVVDITVYPPKILRPGVVTLDKLREVDTSFELCTDVCDNNKPKSPGMKYTHYSPAAKLIIFSGKDKNVIDKINDLVNKQTYGKKAGILTCSENAGYYDSRDAAVISVGDRTNLESVASNLYKTLRLFDYKDVDVIYSEAFPVDGLGFSIMDRLKKASGNTIIQV